MGITREVSYPIIGLVGTFHTSSTWAAATTGSTGHIVNHCSTYYGQVIDRTELGANFQSVDVSLSLQSSWGTTEGADPRRLEVNVWLQHGASSGGGDMANLAPPATIAATNFFTTVDTTDMWKASTYGGRLLNETLNPGVVVVNQFDLNGAYRYLRPAFSISRKVASTCSQNVEGAWLSNMLIFRDADRWPPKPLLANSTSTSTST